MILQSGKQSEAPFQPETEGAFSRIDLFVVIIVLMVLGGWLALAYTGENGRIVRCTGNLSALGRAMQTYADHNQEALPAAGIDWEKNQFSWDMRLQPYLSAGKPSSEQAFAALPRFFFCPSDDAKHNGTPRSYAMGGNDMSPDHWPPGPDSATGVGLWWDGETIRPLLGDMATQKIEQLPVVKLADIPRPADTVLLTEFIDPNNNLGSTRLTSVASPTQQRQFFKDGAVNFHHGRFNYLMVDGHVELLSALQTGSFDGSAGIWSLKKGN
jgi:prepilin-type processing-associated H-X9-DG protein